MIAMLRGKIAHWEPGRAIIDVNGVGYDVLAPGRALEEWRSAEQAVVHVSTQVREDSIALYGFASQADRAAFQTLMSVSGIGPKLAMACIDAYPLSGLVRAIESEDLTALAKIPGVGKKTAQRLCLELKGKLIPGIELPAPGKPPPAPEKEDVLALALAQLGYSKSEIDSARLKLKSAGFKDDAKPEERVRAALRVLSGGEA